MDRPSQWIDFSTECVYTSQKHKKHKVWRDGICTCCLVRGWIVLKLYPEGASTTSDPLEEWRIPPSAPSTVAKQEIEFDVHLVQLLGRPQPFRGQQQFMHQRQPAQVVVPQCSTSQILRNTTAIGPSSEPLLRRRLPGGLFRPGGVRPPCPINLKGPRYKDAGLLPPMPSEDELSRTASRNHKSTDADGCNSVIPGSGGTATAHTQHNLAGTRLYRSFFTSTRSLAGGSRFLALGGESMPSYSRINSANGNNSLGHAQTVPMRPCGQQQAMLNGRGITLSCPPQHQPLLLVAEELPQNAQLKNLADLVPITFCTTKEGPLPFNTADEVASHVIRPLSFNEEALSARQLTLQYFNSIVVSLQTALTGFALDFGSRSSSRPLCRVAWNFMAFGSLAPSRMLSRLISNPNLRGVHTFFKIQRRQEVRQQQHRRRHRKKRHLSSEMSSVSTSDERSQNDSSKDDECCDTSATGTGLLLDYWFDDWAKVVLARSLWRGVNPHSQCIRVSVTGPWPTTQNSVALPLLRFSDDQFKRAAMRLLPPLLLHIRQILRGGCQAIGRAKIALNGLVGKNIISPKCPSAATWELGDACTARIIGFGSHDGQANASIGADAAIQQLLELDLSNKNKEGSLYVRAAARWFSYTDGGRPFAPRLEHRSLERGEIL
ncbi:hypothetical protein cyc_08096 [Cyclospora cayetanensis]|uniref:5'-3' DNA helicase ZGRF1-like N-terminal domain-containing protein n=1 Tax=Cyclospora cayetanensis TaxID=88456 RepID=A0A1D3CTP6_9EIME|nr:hypothetical protein cyc_08096 [Cyclospora cayetanensis]